MPFSLWLLAAGLSAQEPHYLAPGGPDVGGVHHLALIYHGAKNRVPWDAAGLLPYVAHVDAEGKPVEWLFDSFLMIEFATDSGAWLHHYREGHPQPTASDWAWLADAWFRDGLGLDGLEAAVEQAGQALGEPDHVVNVVITLPVPLVQLTDFGPLGGRDGKLDFSRLDDRRAALSWYLDRVMSQWQAKGYRHLRLAGFYWLAESIPTAEHEVVRAAADLVHGRGLKLYWIPFFGATGVADWRELGIDAMMLQPNHFFHPNLPDLRLLYAAIKAKAAGAGIEIEFDGRALTDEAFRRRFYGYLDAGATYGWMDRSILGYYEGGRAVRDMAASPGVGRELYEALCDFVHGRYRPSGKVELPDLVEHDYRDNLALAAKGAKIHGCQRPEGTPELAPETILDGDILLYGGMSGFGYFAWPGSFTVELPEEHTVARVQTMLWSQDERYFRYRIETSRDNEHWEPAVAKSEGEWRGWQVDTFAPREAKYIRFTGLYNSINGYFQVVEMEVYERPR